MAINPHDDYEALAKLLYPSIEASGNVYYGQTRKLTMDEIFDKNDNGFHSHIKSLKNDDSKYDTYFCWELGPLKGIVKVPEVLPAVPMCFAKYELVLESESKDNILDSGNYKTYECSIKAVFDSIVITRGKEPLNNENWDGANFYINKEGSLWYTYIALKDPFEMYDSDPGLVDIPGYIEDDEFSIKSKSSDTVSITLRMSGTIGNTNIYQYSIVGVSNTSTSWETLALNTPITFNNNESLKLRFDTTKVKSAQSHINYLYLEITGGVVELHGDFRSLQSDESEIQQYEFYNFLSNNNCIKNAKYCKLYSEKILRDGCDALFKNCTSLVEGPDILYRELECNCLVESFSGCTSLVYAKGIHPFRAISTTSMDDGGRFGLMFDGCTSLKIVPSSIYSYEANGGDYYKMFNGCTSLEVPPYIIHIAHCTSETHTQFIFNQMFAGCSSLRIAPTIILGIVSGNGTFCKAFYGCESLTMPPRLIVGDTVPTIEEISGAFEEAFAGCSKLKCSPQITTAIPKQSSQSYSYYNYYKKMFEGCSSLSKIYVYSEINSFENNDLVDWVKDVAPSGDFYYDKLGVNHFPLGDNGIPTGWTEHNIYDLYKDGTAEFGLSNTNEYLVISGTNSIYNGRGDITDESTLENMEKSFDENNTHQMNTYNVDGSYNQEIWGYKSFNSPEKFRNGIYTDSVSIVSSHATSSTQQDVTTNETSINSNKISGNNWEPGHGIHSSIVTSNLFRDTDECSISSSALVSSCSEDFDLSYISNDFITGAMPASLDFSSLNDDNSGLYTTSIVKIGYLGNTMGGSRVVLHAGPNGFSIDNTTYIPQSSDYCPIECNGRVQFNDNVNFKSKVTANEINGDTPHPLIERNLVNFPIGSICKMYIQFTVTNSSYSNIVLVPGSTIYYSNGEYYIKGFYYGNTTYTYDSLSIDSLEIVGSNEDGTRSSINKPEITVSLHSSVVLLNNMICNGSTVSGASLIQIVNAVSV
jgi:hypothetical protein